MPSTILKIIYFVGLIAGSVIRAKYTRNCKGNKIIEDQKTITDAIFAALPGIGMFILPIIYILTSWLDFADYHLPAWIGWIAIILFAIMLWLLWKSHVDLKHNWSPSLQIIEGHELVTDGIYQHIRHPMYAAHLVWGIAQPLLLQNWIVGFSMLVTLNPVILYRIPREELMLLQCFGEQYRSYIKRTSRMIPYLW